MADSNAPPPAASEPSSPPSGEVKEILAKMAEFAQLLPQQVSQPASSIDFLRDVPITITAQLGHVVMPIGEILKLGPGAVVELEEMTHQPIALTVRGVAFATGEVVVVDDRFAIRIKTLLSPKSPLPGVK
jgi:flagellar motor switch protein FliN/FliY